MSKKSICAIVAFILFSTLTINVSASQNRSDIYPNEPPSLFAQGAVLIEQRTGRVLYEKNKDQKLYPASTTKIIAALVAIEAGDLDEIVTVGNEANLAALDGSKAGLDIGEQITLGDLVRALMLASGNDAGYTIAVHLGRKISGDNELSIRDSIEVFNDLMNHRAAQIGAKNSVFLNPHGYHQEGHYTTAYDLGLITREALNNEFFRTLVAQRIHEHPDWSSKQDDPTDFETRYWVSRNRLLNPQSEFYYPYATGVKTGWTTPAGPCLVSSASKDGMELVSVVLNTTREGQWLDSINLFEYGFNNYTFHELIEQNRSIGSIPVELYKLGGLSEINLVTQNGFEALFNRADIPNINSSITWDYNCPEGKQRMLAPIDSGEVLGTLSFNLNGETIFETELVATTSIEKRTIISTIVYRTQNGNFLSIIVLIAAGVASLVFVLKLIVNIKRRNKSKKKLTFRSNI